MSQGPLCPNLSQKVQAEVSQMANRNLSRVILLGGLSVNLNHLKTSRIKLEITRVFSIVDTEFEQKSKTKTTNCIGWNQVRLHGNKAGKS